MSFSGSLKDGRSVWLDGVKVDVTTHPAFTGTLETITYLLALLDDENNQSIAGFKSPKSNQFVHSAFYIPRSYEDLIKRKKAFALWSNKTYGVMSRLSDYANSLITGYYLDRHQFAQYDAGFVEKITKYYELARDERRIVTTAILDPQIDRSKPAEEQDEDALLRIIRETEEGVVVRGAKMIATGAPYAHDVIVTSPQKLSPNQIAQANMFIVPLNLPGLQIVCRESFASNKEHHKLSSRFDEMDAVLLFDDVLIPWDRVLIKGSPEGVLKAHRHQQIDALAQHQTVVRLLSKLEFIAGVTTAIAQSIGADYFLHVQEKIGELYTQIDSIEALLISSEKEGHLNEQNVYLPNITPLQTARNLGTHFYGRALDILKQIGAGGFIQLSSSPILENHELYPLFSKYYKGAKVDARTKENLFRIGWELIGSQLGSRHDLYERFYTGDPIRVYALQYETYDKSYLKNKLNHFLNNLIEREVTEDEYADSVFAEVE
ncbi:4-hydroxyphenylacetate 3-hydroxylase [Lysinibacillus xylanilyticus]|uniref:4-hydroxyphenylacetate 3-hydroxylase n=1 Tax=Lysinibacillus xylanilyticus TaxID=582475 RepID=A0A0K9FH49_9BACI|nr:4-hydroxyphenylacetate 3-hydroxylase N-terminal domain-containing protein [Lysinibacillus xylanilyticus]KMY33874.1 4-hydroxyphenylacetate 3-hydroxylase [Lysinibacillus xylanilyticus]